ncbi:hypothetical protein SDC9_151275 [bioreactor metagenome]|uniref:Uncharacterized protein n=1 Tax=bioreactor metagenome TaxID=1076179 RepID=A0A645ES71_9ZZZZ
MNEDAVVPRRLHQALIGRFEVFPHHSRGKHRSVLHTEVLGVPDHIVADTHPMADVGGVKVFEPREEGPQVRMFVRHIVQQVFVPAQVGKPQKGVPVFKRRAHKVSVSLALCHGGLFRFYLFVVPFRRVR